MLKRMKAVVSPQAVVGDCIDAVKMTGLGRGVSLANSLPISHFTFVVHPDDHAEVSSKLSSTLTRCVSGEYSPEGGMTMGYQSELDNNRSISWYYGNPLPGLAVTTDEFLPLQAGGGYVTVYTPSLPPTHRWLQARGIECSVVEWHGKTALWVPLITPDYGVGEGYYALMVITDSLDDSLPLI